MNNLGFNNREPPASTCTCDIKLHTVWATALQGCQNRIGHIGDVERVIRREDDPEAHNHAALG